MSKKPNQNAKTSGPQTPGPKTSGLKTHTQKAPPPVIEQIADANGGLPIEQPAESKKSPAELAAILKGVTPQPETPASEPELDKVSPELTADLQALATELMAPEQEAPEQEAPEKPAPQQEAGTPEKPDAGPDAKVGPGTRFLVKVTGPTNKVGRGRYVEARCYLTPWRCQANQFASKAEASSFAETLDPAPGLSLQVVGWDKAWSETLPDAKWKGTPKIATKSLEQGAASQAG